MKEKKLFDAISDVSDELVEEARITKPAKRKWTWKQWTAAACAVLLIGAAVAIPQLIKPDDQPAVSTSSGEAAIIGKDAGGKALLAVNYPRGYGSVVDDNPLDDAFLAAVDTFTYETTAQLFAGKDGNLNYSPLSLYYALSIAASGANGETADELLGLLGVADASELSAQCGNLYRRLYTDNPIGALQIANSLWVDSEVNGTAIAIKDAFVQNAAENFYASVHPVDFANAAAGEVMAQWVADNTHGTLSPAFETDSAQILSILNTVYFCDEWMDRFDKDMTESGIFYGADGEEIPCDYMNSRYSSASFTQGDGFTRASLGLKNAGSMVFILPDEGVSPYELLSSPERMREAFESGEPVCGEVVWQLPKFGFGSALDMADALKALGVNAAFQTDADFSGITDSTAFVSRIRQETHIAIDENGVEASAFTEIGYAGAAPPGGRAEMILNRPFIYGITAPGGQLLFVGVCANPSSAS